MSLSVKRCLDCETPRPRETFPKTKLGEARGDRCWDCIEKRAEVHREDVKRKLDALDAELEEYMLSHGSVLSLPGHLLGAFEKLGREARGEIRGPWKPKERRRSNRPHMVTCWGCGEFLPKLDLYEYRAGGRSHYCRPCTKRRAVERECADCGATKLTTEFFEGLRSASPYCRECRGRRLREKHCPKCETTKPLDAFGTSGGRALGWCKRCRAENTRERREQWRIARAKS